MLPRGQKIAKEMYGCRGTCAHHNTDIWGDCAPADYYVPSTLWPMGSLWLSLHIFEHYQYTHNQEFILEYFPILKENALFFLDYMFKDANGFYATGPSVSPGECLYDSRWAGCNSLLKPINGYSTFKRIFYILFTTS